MSITRRRIQALEKLFGSSAELDKALAAVLSASPRDFGSFIGAAMNQASEQQLKAVSIVPDIEQRFFASKYIEIIDQWIAEADAQEAVTA